MNELEINRALDKCYEAVVDHTLWPSALHALAQSVDAACAMFYPENPNGSVLLAVPASREYVDFLPEYVKGNWFENHYRAERGWPLLRTGQTVIEHDLVTEAERRRLRHYNELYLRHGFSGFAAVPFRLEGRTWCVPFLRGTQQDEFTHEDSRRLAFLAPHFRRMIGLTEAFVERAERTGVSVLERMNIPALLLDDFGRVTQFNDLAKKFIGHGFQIRAGRLHASDLASDVRLEGTLKAALASKPGDSPSSVSVRCGSEKTVIVEGVGVSGALADILPRSRALIIFRSPGKARSIPESLLADALKLTPAEARVARRVAEGQPLRRIAQDLGISEGTARVHLKAIFAKAGVHRQGELVAFLSSLRS